jgi:hypothetical protein
LNNSPALSNMLLPDLSSFKNFTQHRSVLSYQLFWTTYWSQLHEAGSPRRPATFRYAVYMVWVVNNSQRTWCWLIGLMGCEEGRGRKGVKLPSGAPKSRKSLPL